MIRRRTSIAAAAWVFVVFGSPPVFAQTASGALEERYESVRKALEESRAREEQARAEHDRLAEEARSLRERLIANAARVQQLEYDLAATEAEIQRLEGVERTLVADLSRDRRRVGRLLAVLQRLDADEPPALIMRPEDALAATRSTMVLGTMLPPVYEQAAALARNLEALNQTRDALVAKNAQNRRETAALEEARADLTVLVQQRERETSESETRLADIRGIGQEIAKESSDLKSLIDRIETLRAQGTPETGMVIVTPGRGGQELSRGSLRQPVIGTAEPGDPAGPGRTPGGGAPLGLWFLSKGGAQAVAPGDGEIVFAGAYQNLGQVLILEMNGGYHLTLAGLGRIDVNVGDLVLAGEPLGVLPAGELARLYMELRRRGRTVDPAPWMRAELRKAKES